MTISRADFSQSASDEPNDQRFSVALADLQDASDYAREEGFPIPSKSSIDNARYLLNEIHKISPLLLEVYPTPDGEIAIHSPNGRGRSVLLLCSSDGGALCLANLEADIAAKVIRRRTRSPTSSCDRRLWTWKASKVKVLWRLLKVSPLMKI